MVGKFLVMEPKIIGSRYVLVVKDIKQSADYYQSKLGFRWLWEGGCWHFLVHDAIQTMSGEDIDAV